ncbi:lipoprotein [Spirosoma migulaei]
MVKAQSVLPPVQWNKAFGILDGFNSGLTARQTKDGGYLAVGYSNPSSGVFTYDGYVVKTDAYGTKLWEKYIGGSAHDYLMDFVEIEGGNYLLVGYSESLVSGTKTAPKKGISDVWVIQIDANGNKLWDKTYGGSSSTKSFLATRNVLKTADGGYVIMARTNGPAGNDKSQTGPGGDDIWLLKIDANGNKLWDKTYGGSGNEGSYTGIFSESDIIQTSDGGYLLALGTTSPADGDISAATYGSTDAWILKVDATGTKIWDKRFGGGITDYIISTFQIADGGYLLCGSSSSSADGNITAINHGNYDFWVVKIDANGAKLWDKLYGGSSAETLRDAVATTDGGFILMGSSSSPIGGDVSEATSTGNQWYLKIDAVGTKIWDKKLPGNDDSMIIAATNDGGYIVCGLTFTDLNTGTSAILLKKLGYIITDLSLTVLPLTQTANRGDQVSYTYTISNTGQDATGVTAKIKVPQGLSLVNANAQQGSYNAVTKIWDIGTMPVGSKTLTLTLKVD